MGDLSGLRIDETYDGLIKTNDEQPVNATLKGLQDGVGNNIPVQVSTTAINFTGTVTGDNNTTYQFDLVGDGNNVVMEIAGSDVAQQDITFVPGTGVSFGLGAPNELTINSTGGGVTYTLSATQATPTTVAVTLTGSDASTDTITLSAGGNVNIAVVNDVITFSSTDTNTTYDYGSAQDGTNVDLKLVPSIGATDTVKLVAGTGVTLTDSGTNQVTIAATGGGSAGLVVGTGLNSLQNAVGGPSVASGDRAVALGNVAIANQPDTVAIGDGAEATGIGAAAVGQYASASGIYSSAWGRTSQATGEGSVAFGQQAQALAAGSVALGRQVVAQVHDCVTIKRLQMLDYASLDFPDDAAAALGGIALGGVYHTAGVLKIRLV